MTAEWQVTQVEWDETSWMESSTNLPFGTMIMCSDWEVIMCSDW